MDQELKDLIATEEFGYTICPFILGGYVHCDNECTTCKDNPYKKVAHNMTDEMRLAEIIGKCAWEERNFDRLSQSERITLWRTNFLLKQIAKAQRREQAAVEDLKEHANFAATCEHWQESKCGYACQTPNCPGWAWRGPQEAGKGGADAVSSNG